MAQEFPRITANIGDGTSNITQERKILLTGQLNGGTATSGVIERDIISEKQINDLFGRNSQVAIAARAIIKEFAISRIKPSLNIIGVADDGLDASGDFTITGTATENGTLEFYINSTINGKYKIDVTSGETADQIGDKLEAKITANLDAPVEGSNASGVITLTAINAGSQGNNIALGFKGTVAGLTVAKSGNTLSGGSNNPDVSNLFNGLNDRFTSIIYPIEWGISTLTNFTSNRFNVDNNILDGQGFVCKLDSFANIKAEADALNEKTLTYIANNLSSNGSAIFENPLVLASQFVALRELRITNNSNISKIAINGLNRGGSYYGSIPYFNIPLFNTAIIDIDNDFSKDEKESLSNSGVTLFNNNASNTLLVTGEAVTTYKTNILGNADITFKFLNRIDQFTIAREFIFNSLKRDFAQHILTTGEIIAGTPQVNEEIFIAKMLGYYNILSGADYLCFIRGDEQRKRFKEEAENTIDINLSTGTITSQSLAIVTSQLRNVIIDLIPNLN